ncbi:DNA-binding transcriptional regulator YhcF (GntR family) [Anoxybacillus calidus]|uniref:DNA-binding transcriptional regulator YhcF (GntR family) n=1 Tax=[Anoxybacillus] calidus TaxID=575178 RepID=A0A7V9YX92_9BACL|nr:GntR family transcriptional regulator [Anoxybacillus calidus]MBA2870075.1 DNA-binding transcriptional regulator YhcF (GntR family) [Anoxybacillus calidus]
MFIELDFESDIPIYMQLVHAIIEGIATRELKPGDELPPVRTLAADLGVNMLTVNKAYQHLKQLGFIQIHRKKGAVINSDEMRQADDEFYERLLTSLRPLAMESICRRLTKNQFLTLCSKIFDEIELKGGKC